MRKTTTVNLYVDFGVPWRHPSGNDEQEVGYVCIEFIEAMWAGDVIFEDIDQLLLVKAMNIDEIDCSDQRPMTELRGNARQ